MSTTKDFVEYVVSQIDGAGDIRYRKMFGEYLVYVDDRPVFLVCENTVFVKILPETDALCAGCGRGFPYDGAKEHYKLDIDDAELAREAASVLAAALPVPKPRPKKRKKEQEV
ncbi:MAG: TfoX/Sxy family protein [Clostridiales bacterium]|jgi:TfoX/Sxy family transcriptional regulator of competence genes|nr:TfoX/Sxy family protein [Clostridiales bacterium]